MTEPERIEHNQLFEEASALVMQEIPLHDQPPLPKAQASGAAAVGGELAVFALLRLQRVGADAGVAIRVGQIHPHQARAVRRRLAGLAGAREPAKQDS